MSARSRSGLRANNLQPKEKRLSIVFSTVDTTKQGVGRAECTEAKGDDYAARAVGRAAYCLLHLAVFALCFLHHYFKSHSRNQKRKQSNGLLFRFWNDVFSTRNVMRTVFVMTAPPNDVQCANDAWLRHILWQT